MSLHYAVAQLSSIISPNEYQVQTEAKNPNYIFWEHPNEYGHPDKTESQVSCSNPNLHGSLVYYTEGHFQLLHVFIQSSIHSGYGDRVQS